MVTRDAMKLLAKIREAYGPGASLTFFEIQKVAPPECVTPSRRALSNACLNQLVSNGLLKKSAGPVRAATYTVVGSA